MWPLRTRKTGGGSSGAEAEAFAAAGRQSSPEVFDWQLHLLSTTFTYKLATHIDVVS